MKPYTRILPLIVYLLLNSHPVLADNKLEIDDAWIAEAPPVSKVMAAYMKVENETAQDRQAIAMQCREFERAEFHRTVDKEGIAGMVHQQALNIPAKSKLELGPGGYHVMLFNPARRLLAGDITQCSIEFDNGETIDFDLVIRKSSSEDHSHHHHH
ncbi:MAG: copper chaperone PCu(A)C [Gammaproteobacteria bacterium]|jgi:copper(I)-binding protein